MGTVWGRECGEEPFERGSEGFGEALRGMWGRRCFWGDCGGGWGLCGAEGNPKAFMGLGGDTETPQSLYGAGGDTGTPQSLYGAGADTETPQSFYGAEGSQMRPLDALGFLWGLGLPCRENLWGFLGAALWEILQAFSGAGGCPV